MVWDVSPVAFKIGIFEIRWYGLLFASGYIGGYYLLKKLFFLERLSTVKLLKFLFYAVSGTILGGRLGNCIFYDPYYYFYHPLEVFMTWKGGMSSHGGAIGTLVGIYLYSKRVPEHPYLWMCDRAAPGIAFTGGFIRIGNLMNSEIIGRPTNLPWGVTFRRVDHLPRHPSQLYEALIYFILSIILYKIYLRKKEKLPHGLLLGILFLGLYIPRFYLETLKEYLSKYDGRLVFTTGQLLSIPLVIYGIYLVFGAKRNSRPSEEIT